MVEETPWIDDGIDKLPGDEDEPDNFTYTDEAVSVSQPKPTPQPEIEPQKRAALRAMPGRKIGKKEAHQTTVILMSLMDGVATMIAGPQCKANDIERDMIEEPLERLIQKMDVGAVELLSVWADPIALVMGMAAWGGRIIRTMDKNKPEKPPAEVEQSGPQKSEVYPSNPPAYNEDYTPQLIAEQLHAPDDITSQIGAEFLEV